MSYRNRLTDLLAEPPQPQRNRLSDFLGQPSTADVLARTEVDRGDVFPIVQYGDGRFELGVPGYAKAAGAAVGGMLQGIYEDPLSVITQPFESGAELLWGGAKDAALSGDSDAMKRASGQAMDVAGMVGAGSLAVPKPNNALGAFGARVPRGGFEIDYFGTPVQIVQNPSKQQMAALIGKTKYKAVRRLQDADGNTYIWDAADPALHDLVAESLGLPKGSFTGDMLGID